MVDGLLTGGGKSLGGFRTQPYGEDDARFKYSVFLVLNNRLVSASVALLVLYLKKLPYQPVSVTHQML
eukprot:4054064-Pyramimonas_sp.AAC.1